MQTDNSRKDTSNAVVRYFCIEVRSASDILAYKIHPEPQPRMHNKDYNQFDIISAYRKPPALSSCPVRQPPPLMKPRYRHG